MQMTNFSQVSSMCMRSLENSERTSLKGKRVGSTDCGSPIFSMSWPNTTIIPFKSSKMETCYSEASI